MQKRKKPKFKRQKQHSKKRVSRTGWKKPRGTDSKQRKGKKSRGKHPKIGYRQAKTIRGKHPSGFEEIMITNLKNLQEINPKTQAIRLSSSLGYKKKQQIIKKAEEQKIKILNKGVTKPKKKIKKAPKKTKTPKKEEKKKEDNKKETKKEEPTKKPEEKTKPKEQKKSEK